jgi:hypothetical protein
MPWSRVDIVPATTLVGGSKSEGLRDAIQRSARPSAGDTIRIFIDGYENWVRDGNCWRGFQIEHCGDADKIQLNVVEEALRG